MSERIVEQMEEIVEIVAGEVVCKARAGDRRQATGDSTGGRAQIYRGDNTTEQIVDVPQIQEQNVELMKVILQKQCQRMRFYLWQRVERELWAARKERVLPHSPHHTRVLAYFESVWEGSCGLHAKSVCCPTAHHHTRGLILSASDGIWNMLFSTYPHTSQWVTFGGHFRHTCECSLSRSTFCINALVSSSVG